MHNKQNGLLNFDNNFGHTYKTHEYEFEFYDVLVPCIWNSELLYDWCLRTKNALNGQNS